MTLRRRRRRIRTIVADKEKQQLTLLNGYARLLAQCQKIKGSEEACQQQAKKLDDLIATVPDSINDETINSILENNGLDGWKLKAASFRRRTSTASPKSVQLQLKKLAVNLKVISGLSTELLDRVNAERQLRKWGDPSYETFYGAEWDEFLNRTKELLNEAHGYLSESEATFDYYEIGE